MKNTLLGLTVVAAVALGAVAPLTPTAPASPAAQPEDPPKDAEKLPDFPKLDPKNTVQPLTADKVIVGEFAPTNDGKRKLVRVGLACEVCLREGPLEVFMCKKGTKEHEAVVRVDADAKLIHLALIAAGAKPGTRTQFIDPKTEEPKWRAATGSKINVLVHYTKGGKAFTHPAQDWILDRVMTKKNKKDTVIPHGWVFAGSVEIKDPDTPDRPAFYGANSGDIISISNFPYSMLEMPVEISKDDANLTYEARTPMLPALFSKVWVILEPVPEKK